MNPEREDACAVKKRRFAKILLKNNRFVGAWRPSFKLCGSSMGVLGSQAQGGYCGFCKLSAISARSLMILGPCGSVGKGDFYPVGCRPKYSPKFLFLIYHGQRWAKKRWTESHNSIKCQKFQLKFSVQPGSSIRDQAVRVWVVAQQPFLIWERQHEVHIHQDASRRKCFDVLCFVLAIVVSRQWSVFSTVVLYPR